MRPLAVTGATGFLGRRLLAHLPAESDVRLLVRDTAKLPTTPAGWRAVRCDLLDPASYRDALAGIDTVVHLAARTGAARPAEHHRANVEATTALLAEARRAGAKRFLFVSSIAAGYSDRRAYHYANAKLAAEQAVIASDLETLVVRPTMIFGPGSAVLANLTKLAALPQPFLFGPGQMIQPVHVEDVAEGLAAILDRSDWGGRIVEYGGPTVLSTTDLFARIRQQHRLPPRAPWRIPLEPLRTLLGLVEPVLFKLLPFTAGQLAAFANPAVVSRPGPPDLLPPARRDVDQMLAAR
ncbi:MAG: NAD-dependent epimerase/dehydratase family protein [Gemmatimonadales bacterium]